MNNLEEMIDLVGKENLYNVFTTNKIMASDVNNKTSVIELQGADFTNEGWVRLMTFPQAIELMIAGGKVKRVGEHNSQGWTINEEHDEINFSFSSKHVFSTDWMECG